MNTLLAAAASVTSTHNSLAVDILSAAVFGGTAILYAGLGETISERAGVINVGTEGTMLVGALAGFAGAVSFSNVWLGVLVGALAGAALAAVHAFMVVYRGASQLASGLVIMFLAIGLTDLYGNSFVSTNMTNTCPNRSPRKAEKVTKLMLTDSRISSIDIRMMMTFFRFRKMPMTPITKTSAPTIR